MDDFKPTTKEQGERMLASMYAHISRAHRCLAIMHQRADAGDDEGAQQMREKADEYFDNAELVGKVVFDTDVHVARYTVDGSELADMIVRAWYGNSTNEARLQALHELANVASIKVGLPIGEYYGWGAHRVACSPESSRL